MILERRDVLFADIGGTYVRFIRFTRGCWGEVEVQLAGSASIEEMVGDFLRRHGGLDEVREGVFGVAGVQEGDRVTMTNYDRTFSVEGLRKVLGWDRLQVINDASAVALAIPHLRAWDRFQVGGGEGDFGAPSVVIGPGTGLGISALIPYEGGSVPIIGEGGHVTVAPRTDRESDVLGILRGKFGHVSGERVVSGFGLVNIYTALKTLEGVESGMSGLQPREVILRAREGRDGLAVETVALFCSFLGNLAGNLVLSFGARGGVYITGGIVLKMGELFKSDVFLDGFVDKGRLRGYMSVIPSFVVTHPTPAFLGLKELWERRRE